MRGQLPAPIQRARDVHVKAADRIEKALLRVGKGRSFRRGGNL